MVERQVRKMRGFRGPMRPTTSGGPNIDWEKIQEQAEADRARQQQREKLGIDELRKAIALFDKDYGRGMEARARASASQQAVLSGLGGTTRPGAVSAGLMSEWEDIRRGRLAGAQTTLGQFFGNYRDPYGITPQVSLGYGQLAESGAAREQQFALGRGQLDLGYAQLAARTPPDPRNRFDYGRSPGGSPGGSPDSAFYGLGNSIWDDPNIGSSGNY